MIVMLGAWSTIVESRAVDAVLLALMFVLAALTVRVYVKDGRAAQLQRKQELEKQRTRELEAELGFEPIDFSDLTDERVEELHKEMRKEKGT
jgi:hypothetical protein